MGQSPAGLSATGESDTRNTYDMIAARQELELRPALERLDRVIAASEGIDPGALTFAFRPLWQLDAATAATIALQKAQATQVYAGLNLWPVATTARLVEAQLAEDGTYPNARAVFGEGGQETSASPTLDYDPDQPRDGHGRWIAGLAAEPLPSATTAVTHATRIATPPPRSKRSPPTTSGGILSFLNALNPIGTAQAQEIDPEEESRRPGELGELEPGDVILIQRFNAALQALREVDPNNQNLRRLEPPGYVPTQEAVGRIEAATRAARNARADPVPPPEPPALNETPQSPSADPTTPSPPNLTIEDLARVERGFAGPKSAQKWLNQMNNRGWTPEQIEEAISDGQRIPGVQRIDPTHGATRYVHPLTGRSVTIDDVTGQVIQLDGDTFRY